MGNFGNIVAGTGTGAATGGAYGGWAGAAIGAAIGLIGSVITNRMNRKANEKLADKQFEQNKEMWNLSNQYNSASAQAARLKSAGINPAVQYGQGTITGNTSDSTPNLDYSGAMASPALPDAGSYIQQALSIQQAKASINETNSKAALNWENLRWLPKTTRTKILADQAQTTEAYMHAAEMQQQIINLVSTNKGIELNNETIKTQLDILQASQQAQIDAYSLNNRKLEKQIEQITQDIEVRFPEEMAQIRASVSNLTANAQLAISQNDPSTLVGAQNHEQARQLNALVNKIVAETGLTEEQVKYVAFNSIEATPWKSFAARGYVIRDKIKSKKN